MTYSSLFIFDLAIDFIAVDKNSYGNKNMFF